MNVQSALSYIYDCYIYDCVSGTILSGMQAYAFDFNSYDIAFIEGCHQSVSLRLFNLLRVNRNCAPALQAMNSIYELSSLSWHRQAQGWLCDGSS